MDRTNANTALASAFAEELFRCGVRQAVVSPGSRSTPLAVALWREPGIEVTVALDERSGSFFALGAARASGRPVALLCTSGTAAANFHPAVAEADLSAVPLIVLTADRPPELRAVGAGQTIDQIKLFGAAVRWFSEVGNHDADDAGLLHYRSTACRAFALAAGDPRPGPVHLNLPWREPLAPVADRGAVTATRPLALEGRGDRPLTAVDVPVSQASLPTLDAVVTAIGASDRVLLVAGRQPDPALREPLTRMAGICQAVILAEPTSQLRFGPHDRSAVITAYDRIVARRDPALAPDLIIRIGETPTSKRLRGWIAGLDDLEQIVIDPAGDWYEPSRTADLILRTDPAVLLRQLENRTEHRIERGGDGAFARAWQEAEAEERHRIESAWPSAGDPRPTEAEPEGPLPAGAVHAALARGYADGEIVYTASSLPIRDQEEALPTLPTDVHFIANRGANGIDGLLASGLGAARVTGRPVTVITGDLGFFHDVSSLALARDVTTPVRVVVLDNGGGGIFDRLPQKEALGESEFEALMATPSGLSVEAAAELYGLPHRRVETLAELAEPAGERPGDGVTVIEVPIR